jgi:hypothetical protein
MSEISNIPSSPSQSHTTIREIQPVTTVLQFGQVEDDVNINNVNTPVGFQLGTVEGIGPPTGDTFQEVEEVEKREKPVLLHFRKIICVILCMTLCRQYVVINRMFLFLLKVGTEINEDSHFLFQSQHLSICNVHGSLEGCHLTHW